MIIKERCYRILRYVAVREVVMRPKEMSQDLGFAVWPYLSRMNHRDGMFESGERKGYRLSQIGKLALELGHAERALSEVWKNGAE